MLPKARRSGALRIGFTYHWCRNLVRISAAFKDMAHRHGRADDFLWLQIICLLKEQGFLPSFSLSKNRTTKKPAYHAGL